MNKPFDIKGHTTVYGGISGDGIYRYYNSKGERKKYELRSVNGKVILVEVGRKVI